MLFVQADRGLGAILLSVKQPEELPVIFPIPTRIAYVHESFLLDFARNVAERRESVGRWRTFWPKLFFLGKPERTNARENFQPREKKPTDGGRETADPVAGNKINRKKSGSENSKRTRFLCIGILKTAQANAERNHAECKENAKKH